MTSLVLTIAGLAGMSLFWILALLVWRIAPPPAATSNQELAATWREEPTYVEPLPTRTNWMASPPRPLDDGLERRSRRNCMFVDAVDNGKSEDEEIDRHATGIFVAHEDSPRPRTAREGQDLATRPFKRARPRLPQAAGERED